MGPPIVLYDYRPTRGGEHPRNFLAGFSGYLHVDGYSGYHKVSGVTLVGCWAHARRKFDEALKVLPASQDKTETVAKQGLEFCNQLFAIERVVEGRHIRRTLCHPIGAKRPRSGCLFGMATSAAVPDIT